MKKMETSISPHVLLCKGLRRFVLKKCLFLFLFFIPIVIFASVPPQSEIVSLNIKNGSIKQLLEEIQRQTSLEFVYNDVQIQGIGKISYKADSKSVSDILSAVLANSDLTYEVKDNIILLKKKEAQKQEIANMSTVSGKVVDKKGEPLPGVTILVKGTSMGVVSDIDGTYKIKVASLSDVVLVYSFVGMKTQEVKVNGRKVVNVTLQESQVEMDEVVVNGIFERKASSFTGSVTTISKDDLKRVGNSNVLQSLKNLDPSVMFFDNMDLGSDPNAVPEMVLRGKSSIATEQTDLKAMYQNDPNAPLFVLDGFEVSIQKIMDLDMDRVESLTILKDASAKAIYGSKAANGVIVIELKKNASGELRLSYTGSVNIEAPDLSSYDLCNATEKLNVEKAFGMYDDPEASFNSQRMMNKIYNMKLSAVKSGINTDWLSKPLHLGVGTKHGVSVELGDKELRAIIDLSYNGVTGVMKGSDRSVISGGISLSYRHKKFLFRDQLTITSNVANDSKYGNFSDYASLNPYYTPYDQYGNISKNIVPILETPNDVYVGSWYSDISFVANPLYNAKLKTVLQNKYIDVTNNFDIQWFVTSGLKFTARLGLTEQRNRKDNFYPADHLKFSSYTGEDANRKGSYDLTNGELSSLSGKFDASYNFQINDKNMFFTNLGFDLSQSKSQTNLQQAEGFPSDKMNDIIFAKQYLKDSKPSGTESTKRDFGYYLSANYSYDSRINIDGTLRRNASSIYGSNSRWGLFWSTGISWNLHNEAWLKGTDITQLRLRATTGSTGSQSSAAYNAIASYSYFLDKTYDNLLGAQLLSMRNEDLKWQEKVEQNIGIDLNYKKRYSLSFEYYYSVTNNALNPLTLVPSTGFSTVQENVGKVVNKGFDMRVSATLWQQPSERSYFNVSLMVSHNKNILKNISDAMRVYNELQIKNSTSTNKPLNKYYDGVSMDAIWAMRSLGIDPATGREIYLAKGDDNKYYRTFNYDASKQEICGDALPKFSGNTGLNFQYRGFGISTVFTFQYGAKMYNTTLVSKVENVNMNDNVDRRVFADRWREPGDHSPYRAIGKVLVSEENAYVTETTQATSRFVQKRNELKFSSLAFSYDFFRYDFVKKIGAERIVLKINANDLATFSSIKVERGLSYPFARTFNGSLSVIF